MDQLRNSFEKLTIFENKVLKKVSCIPKGEITTYKFLAKAVGRSKTIRAIGNALGKNSNLIKIPCHRVVRSDGKIGGYRLGLKKKKLLLEKEGIRFIKNKVKNLDKVLYKFK